MGEDSSYMNVPSYPDKVLLSGQNLAACALCSTTYRDQAPGPKTKPICKILYFLEGTRKGCQYSHHCVTILTRVLEFS